MKKFYDLIIRNTSLRVFLFLLFMFLLFWGLILLKPLAGQFALDQFNETGPLDFRFFYTGNQAYNHLTLMGNLGRDLYENLLALDMFFPIIYGGFFLFTLALMYRNLIKIKALYFILSLPVFTFIADYLENISILIILDSFPSRLITLASLSGFFTAAKWAGLALILIFILSGLILRIRTRRPRLP